jgi:hypothetical protein
MSRVRVPAAALAFASFASALAFALASCSKCNDGAATKDAAPAEPPSATVSASVSVPGSAASAPMAVDAAPVSDAATSATSAADAASNAASSCRLAYGPAEQPFRGPAALVVTASELRLVANDSGKPRIYPVPLAAPPAVTAPSVVPPAPSSFVGMRWPPCEIAGKWAYCQAAGGMVYRTALGTTDTKQIAKSRASTRIAAAAVGPDHAVLATLETRRTTEGEMLQAFITLDNGETQRLSDEGAGATVVRLVQRGDTAIALYLDARTAMLPVHARPIALKPGGDLALGSDAVVFVGGPPERGIDIAPARAGRAVFALLPMARETTEFGMAAIPIAEKPKEDVPPVWSIYPNGLDPAPIVATVAEQADAGAGGFAWVARVRPSERAAGTPRMLELGKLDGAGAFTSLGALATGKRITDLAIATDTFGSVWILYGDENATWLERRVCP